MLIVKRLIVVDPEMKRGVARSIASRDDFRGGVEVDAYLDQLILREFVAEVCAAATLSDARVRHVGLLVGFTGVDGDPLIE